MAHDVCGLFARHPQLFAAYMQVRDLAAMVGIEAGDEVEFDYRTRI